MNNAEVSVGPFRGTAHPRTMCVLDRDGKPQGVSLANPVPVSQANIPGGAIPFNDTIVESPSNALSIGGTIKYYVGGADGALVAQLTITVAGGNTTITRTV